jgi:hypothetical protein
MMLAAWRPTAIAGVILNDIGPVIEPQGWVRIKGYVGNIANHRTTTKAGITLGVYVHHAYEREKREALELWAPERTPHLSQFMSTGANLLHADYLTRRSFPRSGTGIENERQPRERDQGSLARLRSPSTRSRMHPRGGLWLYDLGQTGAQTPQGARSPRQWPHIHQLRKEATPDGFRVDVDGNLWCGWGMNPALDGVKVFKRLAS